LVRVWRHEKEPSCGIRVSGFRVWGSGLVRVWRHGKEPSCGVVSRV